MTTKRYDFLTLLHTPHIESLFDLSVEVHVGIPTLGVHAAIRSRKSPERSGRRMDTEGS